MAEFLTTEGITYHLMELIKNAEDKLLLVSPFVKINDRLKQLLQEKNRAGITIKIVYGKDELQAAEKNWLNSLENVMIKYCKNLHAKCYLNEKEAIITSMNLYEFSQVNNYEMGIYITREDDTKLYEAASAEIKRLLMVTEESQAVTDKTTKKRSVNRTKKEHLDGHCIRCNKPIKFDPLIPYCRECYNVWKKYGDEDYPENQCHLCGKDNKSTLIKPLCYSCFRKL